MRNPRTLQVSDTFEEELNRWALEAVPVVDLDKQLGLLNDKLNDPTARKLFQSLNEKLVNEKLVKIDSKIAQVMAIDMLMAGVDTGCFFSKSF